MKKDKIKLKDLTIEEIKKMGFPYYEFDEKEYLNEFAKLKTIKFNKIIDDFKKEIKYYLYNNYHKLASVFFPQMFEVKVNNMKTPIYTFEHSLEKVVKKTFRFFGKDATFSDLRSMLRLFEGTQSVGNFNPTVAKAVYDKWGNFGKVLDFSSGWGGRLVGFLASNCKEYVGVDVNSSLFEGYRKIINTYNLNNKKVIIVKQGSETLLDYTNVEIGDRNFKFKKNYFDFAFSSPPYFNKEMYSNDFDQSYIKFENYDRWLEEFLLKTMYNVEELVKPGAYYTINIAPIRNGNKFYDIVNDLIKKYKEPFMIYDMILSQHSLSKVNFKDNDKRKIEPFLIFKKKGELKKQNTFLRIFS